MRKIILASQSPRRREILEAAGIIFEVITSKKEEKTTETAPEKIVMELSKQKAEEVADSIEAENYLVIGADTMVALDGVMFGKPKDYEEAFSMLKQLSGKTHQVFSGVTLLYDEEGERKSQSFYQKTDVTFLELTDYEIRRYIANEHVLDKAGSYAIQSSFSTYVAGINGEYNNVVGFPIAKFYSECKRLGIALYEDPKIKLVVTDVDGTLVADGSGELYPEIIETIRELREKELLFVVASGRPYASLRRVFDEVRDDVIFVAENGAIIICRDVIISKKSMDKAIVSDIIRTARKYPQLRVMASTIEGVYLEGHDPEFEDLLVNGYRNNIFVVDDILKEDVDIVKVALYHKDNIRELSENILIPQFSGVCKACISGEHWIDFMDETVDKGNALATIQQFFRVVKEETMVFGDNANDLGMLSRATESFVVETAREEIRKEAKHVCASYHNKGVNTELRKLLESMQ